jgi:hypothetical protein
VRKTVASLLAHLGSKWAGAVARLALPPDAVLRLYPLEATAAAPHAGWGSESGLLLAAQLMQPHAAAADDDEDAPPHGVFRLKYGWTAAAASPAATPQPYAPPAAAPHAAPHAAPRAVHAAPPPAAVAVTPGGLLSLLLDSTPMLHASGGRGAPGAAATPVTPAPCDSAGAPQQQHGSPRRTRA